MPTLLRTNAYRIYTIVVPAIEIINAYSNFTPPFRSKGNKIKNKSDGMTIKKISLDNEMIFSVFRVS
jgi:hypothetical protein